MRIGLLGGTFNPIHIGHLILAEEALWKLKLDKLIFVPCYTPPHKTEEDLQDAEDRYNMVVLATEDNPMFEVSDFEINNKDVSYSINTIKEFRRLYGDQAEIFFIAGSDSLKELFSWKEVGEIFNLSQFVIANRPGYPISNVPAKTEVVVITSMEVSSSEIRKRVKENRSIRYLIPEKVREYIVERKLYK